MIDDIELIETPDHLLDLSSETYGGWWIGYQSTGDLGIDYTFNPLSQANQLIHIDLKLVVNCNNGASSPNKCYNISILQIYQEIQFGQQLLLQ